MTEEIAEYVRHSSRRVKLYALNEERLWEDQGTGHVVYHIDECKSTSLIVRSEIDGTLLLDSKVLLDTAYQKQQETLIVWSEGEDHDYALSFQDRDGCDEIWEKICQVQGKDPSLDITQDIADDEEEDELCPATAGDMDDSEADGSAVTSTTSISRRVTLPPCELSQLSEIAQLFTATLSSAPVRRDRLALAVEKNNYIRQLVDLFRCCEDLDDDDGLHQLYAVFRSLFMLNKSALLEVMLSGDTIMDVIGVLEHDPMLPEPARHREFLTSGCQLRQVIPLKNSQLVDKIQQTYRVQYIHDVILPTPSVFEDNLLSTLASYIYFNKMEIVSMLQADESFLKSLFIALTGQEEEDDDDDDDKKDCGGSSDDSDETKLRRRQDVAQFLREFCLFSQTLAPQNRDSFFKTLSSHGLLAMLKTLMMSTDSVLQSTGLDILSVVVEFNPSMVREFILSDAQQMQSQSDNDLLLNVIIRMLKSAADPVLASSVIRLLIDPDNMVNTPSSSAVSLSSVKRTTHHERNHKASFLSLFYSQCIHVLMSPLFDVTAESQQPLPDDYVNAETLSVVLDLLTFCVEHHSYHCKNYVMNKNVGRHVLVLLKSRHAFVSLGALRFLRRMIGLKDDFYNRYVVKRDLLKPVTDAFVANGLTRYNLFNSAVIELFEFILTESITALIKYFVDSHYESVESVSYVQTFHKLKQRHCELQRQQELHDSTHSTASPVSRLRPVLGGMKRSRDDAWFDDDDDDDDDSVPEPKSDVLRGRLDLLEEADEAAASGDNSPGVSCDSDATAAHCKVSFSSSSSSSSSSVTDSASSHQCMDVDNIPDSSDCTEPAE